MVRDQIDPPPQPRTAQILVFRTQVGDGYNGNEPKFDWRPLGKFRTRELAVAAAKTLEIAESRYRIIDSGMPA